MCTEHKSDQLVDRLHRRSFLKTSGAIAATAFVGAELAQQHCLRRRADQGSARQAESERHFSANEEGQ